MNKISTPNKWQIKFKSDTLKLVINEMSFTELYELSEHCTRHANINFLKVELVSKLHHTNKSIPVLSDDESLILKETQKVKFSYFLYLL